jgi:hypothetical protein
VYTDSGRYVLFMGEFCFWGAGVCLFVCFGFLCLFFLCFFVLFLFLFFFLGERKLLFLLVLVQ